MDPVPAALRPRHPQSPWFAVNLSLLFPGLGQLHRGRALRGLAWFLGAIALLLLIFWAYLSPSGNVQIGAGALGMGVMLWAINLVDAHACALGRQHRRFESFSLSEGTPKDSPKDSPRDSPKNSPKNSPKDIKQGKSKWAGLEPSASQSLQPPDQRIALLAPNRQTDPWFAMFLSHLLPGLGQLQRGQLLSGTLLLLLTLLCGTLWADQLGWSLGIPALSALACALLARVQPPASLSQRRVMELVLLIFVGRSLFLSTFPAIRQVVEPFAVPSESMAPTLMTGDRILVYKSRQYQPQPEDIVVFRDPTQNDGQEPRFFVKRIVGGAGDRITVSPGQTQRNDQAIAESYTREPPQYRWDSGEIPPRHFIVLGDNRNESFDSSQWGLLPQSQILGRAYRISWPPERSRPLKKAPQKRLRSPSETR